MSGVSGGLDPAAVSDINVARQQQDAGCFRGRGDDSVGRDRVATTSPALEQSSGDWQSQTTR